ncbi:hypothetical protein [Acidocella aminolytica]|uniref:hypothetical protein n=1 Tax=Acidocella aminolytica TaxID=33998 RepID=UPI0011DE3D16|nr:hypothetical protein [Acidocella aminolytica]
MRDVISIEPTSVIHWQIIRRYMLTMAAGNLLWEILQQPFYTLWQTASLAYLTFAIVHCWIGDLMIAASCLALGICTSRILRSRQFFPVGAFVTLLAGLAYTIFSEWRNMSIHHFWTYSAYMPRLPFVGTGLLPILQWFLIPMLSLCLARKLSLELMAIT